MEISQSAEWNYTVVDLSTDSTTVYTGKCILHGIIVSVALSAHLTLIKDNTTTVAGLPASAAAGYTLNGFDMRILTSLIIDPDNAGTGTITVVWKAFHDGDAA